MVPPLTLIFVVLGSILLVVATVNQAGAIGAVGAGIMGSYRLYEGNKHKYTPKAYGFKGIDDHNFCRNPDNKENAWCFTEDPDMEREGCGFKDHKMAPPMNPSKNEAMLDQQKQCDLVNIPVQRWVHVAMVLVNKTLDVYLNGKLSRSCTLDDVPRLNKGDIYINLDGGFNGELSDLLYTNQAMSAKDIYSLYLSGYNAFSLLSKPCTCSRKSSFSCLT